MHLLVFFFILVLFRFYNYLGQYSPAICLVIASYTGCDRVTTVALLTLGVGLNGGIYSGFKINHLDITPRFAGILMAFTNCTANLAGLLAPIVAGQLIHGSVSIASSFRFAFYVYSFELDLVFVFFCCCIVLINFLFNLFLCSQQ